MNLKDLTKDELLLLNTNFGEEIEKQAAAIVAEENEKVAELREIAEGCLAYGEELAMQKIAEMEQAHQEKVAAEEESKDMKGLDKKKEEEEDSEDSEEEKNASAMGNFILEGYWNTLMEKGAEYYGDENIYLEELCKEAKMGQVMDYIKSYGAKALKGSEKAMSKGQKAVKGFFNPKANLAGVKGVKKIQAAKDAAKSSGKIRRGLGYAGAAGTAAGAGYAAGNKK